MEKAHGVPLETFYRAMDVSDRYAIIQAVARIQLKWTQARFAGFGSIYYAPDLDEKERTLPLAAGIDGPTGTGKYAIGPSTGREWYEDGRLAFDFDRGPCMLDRPI